MYGTGVRAHEFGCAFGVKRTSWNSHLPDECQDVDPQGELGEQDEIPPWFRIKSYHGAQPPSVILVEDLISRSERPSPGQSKSTPDGGASVRTRARNVAKSSPTSRTKVATAHPTGLHDTAIPRDGHATEGLARDRKSRYGTVSSGVIRRMELSTDGFFDFLFSNRWPERRLLRVLRGKVLEDLLNALTILQERYDVISYATLAFIHKSKPLRPCSKTTKDLTEQVAEKVLVELDYYSNPYASERAEQHGAELLPIQCNIRGQRLPPPHDNCSNQSYHIHREAFLQRRVRQPPASPKLASVQE